MTYTTNIFLQNYGSIILLIVGILAGSILGIYLPTIVPYIKPIGDIFLNLLFVAVIPLVFFAISSSVANIEGTNQLGKIIGAMTGVFLMGVLISACATIAVLYFFPLDAPMVPTGSELLDNNPDDTWSDKMVRFLTVSEFGKLLSRENMLALVIFSFLVGIATRKSSAVAQPFLSFLNAGNEVMKNLLILIMKISPIGLGAYFAYQVSSLGPQLFGFYAKPLGLYYLFGTCYFFVGFTVFAFIANGKYGITSYWKNNIVPTLTALGSCSSLATMPANLLAAKKIGVPDTIANVVIPLGTTLHKQGSSISSIFKIYVAFLLIGKDFFDPMTLVMSLGITVLVSVVAGGIPNGGYIGEMLMISVLDLPIEAVPAVMIIGTLVDPLATILNSTGDTVASMLVTKFTGNKYQVVTAEVLKS
ncbi:MULTISPECIES: dicarboxylate/amino acid:cation symporter [Sphingobacterium]|uniref:dicarboxylate/amino acid:cation symporter n=1 Tax=Sphingobacterium TaxID=28453 RepID=UPI0010494864|nr:MULTISPECIES: dicarboxylate/amino acid:cation symporter [Sphingobacterium]MCW2262575.1 Na+/H+-dicarboxylate symporter [Sphingobacterium kitahiroshimense]TCR12677.1 Na+/H+-dicarboxylate symporter [Sphingobacterium sp. JUb78]